MEHDTNTSGVATEDTKPLNGATEPQPKHEASDPTETAGTHSQNAELDRLAREKRDLQELMQRRQAEFENYKKRVERERGELFEFASMDTAKAMLPILDDFERALKAESADKVYARGMELIYQRLYESLKKIGLEPISTEGTLFNPHLHHAVEMVDSPDVPDQTILEEYQRGYNFKGRPLRPAMVKVAVRQ
ncbi:MAG: nucleotide exchange factor GrpE [Bryobacteraceae bacterium]